MDFPDWEKPLAADPARYAALWADDLNVPRDTPAWQEQYAQNLRDIRARAAELASGLHGLPAGAGDAAQVTAAGTRKAAGTEVEFVHYDCGNGLGAVVSRGALSYGREDGLWEAALARTAPDGTLRPPAPGTARELLGWADDVLGRLTPQDVKNLLQQITALRPQAAPGHEPGQEGVPAVAAGRHRGTRTQRDKIMTYRTDATRKEIAGSDLATEILTGLALRVPVVEGRSDLFGRSHAWYSIASTHAAAAEFMGTATGTDRRRYAAQALARAGYELAGIRALVTHPDDVRQPGHVRVPDDETEIP